MAYNKITLHGKQTCDYLYIQSDKPEDGEFQCVDDEPKGWKDTTLLYANFSNKETPLCAGDSVAIGNIVGYEVYRKKYNESYAEYIGTIQKSDKNSEDIMVDYAAKNGVEYIYYFYPNTDTSKSGSTLSPLITEQVAIDCPYWSLLIVDNTDEENVFYLDKLFKFELNLEIGEMNNNAQISIVQNFTKYPTIQYGTSNYWSGSLSSLCGFISSNCVDYIQNTNMINELKSISSDTRRKFLKDVDGNLWEVDISAPISISTENTALQSVKTLSLSWTEVGDANGVSIINNPNKPMTDWVLTENGETIPYFTYQWGENYKWDNSYMWAANNDWNINDITNLNRDIVEEGGDV